MYKALLRKRISTPFTNDNLPAWSEQPTLGFLLDAVRGDRVLFFETFPTDKAMAHDGQTIKKLIEQGGGTRVVGFCNETEGR